MFVTNRYRFNDASDAKLALRANDSNPEIRGTHLRITVPRRFYQRADDYSAPSHRVASAPSKAPGTTITNSTTKPLYTSQDARSDLQKEARSPRLRAKPESPAIEPIAEKAEPLTLPDPEPSDAINSMEETQGAKGNDRSSIVAMEQHVVVEQSVSRASSPKHTTAGGHVRVESQTKTSYEDGEIDGIVEGSKSVKTAIVKVPESSNEDQIINDEASLAQATTESDTSTSAHQVGSGTTNHGIEDPEKPLVASTEDSSTLHTAASHNHSQNTSEPITLRATTSTSSSTIVDKGEVEMSPAVLSANESLAEIAPLHDRDASNITPKTAQTPSYAEAVKQHGPPQTQSINPFAKPSKAQREKNKKMKKKEQKRESKNARTEVTQESPAAQETADASSSADIAEDAHAHVAKDSITHNHPKSPESPITHEPQESANPPTNPALNLEPCLESDNVSVASSATLHPSADARLSPSPDAEDFHTPLQTPTAMSESQQGELSKPKKKKNKNKKKKKSAAAAQTEDHTAQLQTAGSSSPSAGIHTPSTGQMSYDSDGHVGASGGPFTNQLRHIDAVRAANQGPLTSYIDDVRAATKDPTTYYNIVNREMEEAAKKKAEGSVPKATKVSTRASGLEKPKTHSEQGSSLDLETFAHISAFLRGKSGS